MHDLQTRNKAYFICNKWLGLDKDDGLIERLLPVCGSAQKNDFNYLLEKETKYKLNDGHMWLSIISRPIYSSFSRSERLTCCFVLLCMSMLMNIMYYDTQPEEANNNDGLKLGPLIITPQQVNSKLFTK